MHVRIMGTCNELKFLCDPLKRENALRCHLKNIVFVRKLMSNK